MGVFRAIMLAVLIVATPPRADAQFGGGQGELPSGPLVWPPARPSALPPACQQLLALRDETQKHGMAIQKANERRASMYRDSTITEALRCAVAARATISGRTLMAVCQ